MTLTILAAVLVGALLAYANGSNDISKSIATLVGSGVSHYQRALLWGTFWTAMGAILGAVTGAAMLNTFGKGLLSESVLPTSAASLATLAGAACWVLFASRVGLPVSTTHALVGSLVGVAGAAHGLHAVEWWAVSKKVVLPLLLSPLLAFGLTYLLISLMKSGKQPMPSCACIETSHTVVPLNSAMQACSAEQTLPVIQLTFGEQQQCQQTTPESMKLTLDHIHWLSSGAASMARGMNDAPKIVALLAPALLAASQGISMTLVFVFVAGCMLMGCLVNGKKVTQVLATKITRMDHYEGCAANLVTASLVGAGALYGLPMSTTHVSSGGIISAGFKRKSLDLAVLRDILLAWVVTLPLSACAGILCFYIFNMFLNS